MDKDAEVVIKGADGSTDRDNQGSDTKQDMMNASLTPSPDKSVGTEYQANQLKQVSVVDSVVEKEEQVQEVLPTVLNISVAGSACLTTERHRDTSPKNVFYDSVNFDGPNMKL